MVAGLLGVGVVPAGARPPGPADDVPPPRKEIVPFVPELIDFGLLRDTLRERFPDTFAGLVNDGDDAVTIYETRPDEATHRWVARRFATAARKAGVDADLIPRVSYRTAERSLDALFDLKDEVMAERATLEARGVGVEAVGIQDGTNQVVVGVDAAAQPARSTEQAESTEQTESTDSVPSVPEAQSVLESTFGRGRLRAIPWEMADEADRYDDTSPWNGGDQLVSEGSSFTACTSGFGMHDGSGRRYVTTAGHCDSHFWWNTWAGLPVRDDSTFLGTTTGPVWDGVYFGFRVDTQKVLTNGSSNIVWTGTATRRFITAPLDVAQGDPTCIEGSFSLTACGTVWATDFGEGGTQYLVALSDGSTVFGDSGAPSWRHSPFGSLAQGTHVGSLSNGLRVELNIYAVMFFNGLRLNTPWDP
jgi:hypothetical protein